MKKMLILFLALGMSGCTLGRKPVFVTMHDLGPTHITSTVDTSYSTAIIVSTPGWLNRTQIHYRRLYASPTALKSYSRDRWIAPPDKLLSRRFGIIKSAQKFRLTIKLVDFEQRFKAPDSAYTVFSFNVEAFQKESRKLLGQRFFSFQQDDETADAAGTIKSFVELSDRAADELESWLNHLVEAKARAGALEH